MKVEQTSPAAPTAGAARSFSEGKNKAAHCKRRLPIGAEYLAGEGTHFRLWAPKYTSVSLILGDSSVKTLESSPQQISLEAEHDGYWSALVKDARPGMLYKFKLSSGSFPDPASRFQPHGPHGSSQIIDPSGFMWSDQLWRGLGRKGQVIYEMHIGTFTPAGTWKAAQMELKELAELGITALEIMPVADFPGRFGWGYDGVDLFAPTRLYGTPDDFRAFVNEAHRLGLGVILDVVYNHLGPDGNYLKEFSGDYFSGRYENEWGEPLNFDGPNCAPVREFFLSNAHYWIEEFHLDGLRLDATQQIFDCSPSNIQAEIVSAVRKAAKGRSTLVIGENEPQDTRLMRPSEKDGLGMDALWNDDFHHSAMVALTGRSEAYYIDYRGTPQEFISAAKWGYLYQGQWYAWQKKIRGTFARDISPEQFINYLQNHDQIANSLRGVRLHQLAHPGDLKALTAFLLLGPATPMLFQGQEFAASTPFLYFADHNPELARLVAQGRRKFLQQFPTIACPESDPYIVEPHNEEGFHRSKLNFSERDKHMEWYLFTRDLLRLRREDPLFSNPRPGGVDGAVLGREAFVLRFFAPEQKEDRLLLINLGQDLLLSPVPEPLLAATQNREWEVAWSSESPIYGGCGNPPFRSEDQWKLLGHSASVLKPSPAICQTASDRRCPAQM